jgi:hypothetical protein
MTKYKIHTKGFGVNTYVKLDDIVSTLKDVFFTTTHNEFPHRIYNLAHALDQLKVKKESTYFPVYTKVVED